LAIEHLMVRPLQLQQHPRLFNAQLRQHTRIINIIHIDLLLLLFRLETKEPNTLATPSFALILSHQRLLFLYLISPLVAQ